MKKLILIALASAFLMSCGQLATRSEFWQHDTMYKNWDHMKFSWFGYKNPTSEDLQKAADQHWWGIDVPYVPGQ